MTTEHGRAFVIGRLASARNLSELADVWATIALPYQRDPIIYETKDRLKAQMESKT
jgi:hypothetical protein